MSWTRRQMLRAGLGAAAGLVIAGPAGAIGPSSRFRFGQLNLGTGTEPRPSALRRLAWEVEKRTAIDVDLEPVKVVPSSPKLHETPFLYLAGDRGFNLPTGAGIDALRRFCTYGGFLVIDSAEGTSDGPFDRSVRQLLAAIFPPPGGLEVVPTGHVVYESFYLLDRPLGRVATSPALSGIVRDGRLVVVYAQNDLGGAWARDNFGNFQFACEPGGERQRELSFRMGINLVMYALCLDYKSDRVHVPFIMRRRRWKPEDGAEPVDR